jgi:hypothetical protein
VNDRQDRGRRAFVRGMMHTTRRQLLVAAGAGGLALLAPRAFAAPDPVTGGLTPELITVTDRGFAAWWATDAPADTTLRISDGGRVRELVLERGRTVHVAALDDLEPSRTRASSPR